MGKRKTNKSKKIQPTPTQRPLIIYNYPSDFMCAGSYAISSVRQFLPYDEEYIKDALKDEVVEKLIKCIPVEYEYTPEGLKCTARIWVEKRLMDSYINIE